MMLPHTINIVRRINEKQKSLQEIEAKVERLFGVCHGEKVHGSRYDDEAEAEGLALRIKPQSKRPKGKPSKVPGWRRFKVAYHIH